MKQLPTVQFVAGLINVTLIQSGIPAGITEHWSTTLLNGMYTGSGVLKYNDWNNKCEYELWIFVGLSFRDKPLFDGRALNFYQILDFRTFHLSSYNNVDFNFKLIDERR